MSFVSSAGMMNVHCAESLLQQQLTRALIKKKKSRLQFYVVLVMSPKHSKTAYLTENDGKLLHAKIVLNIWGYVIVNKELQEVTQRCTITAQDNALHRPEGQGRLEERTFPDFSAIFPVVVFRVSGDRRNLWVGNAWKSFGPVGYYPTHFFPFFLSHGLSLLSRFRSRSYCCS